MFLVLDFSQQAHNDLRYRPLRRKPSTTLLA
jgi:hypothetical protein